MHINIRTEQQHPYLVSHQEIEHSELQSQLSTVCFSAFSALLCALGQQDAVVKAHAGTWRKHESCDWDVRLPVLRCQYPCAPVPLTVHKLTLQLVARNGKARFEGPRKEAGPRTQRDDKTPCLHFYVAFRRWTF